MTAYSEKDYAKSVKYFKAALQLRPDNAAIAYNIACGYALLKEKDSALNYLEKAVELGLYKIGDDPDLAILQDDPSTWSLPKGQHSCWRSSNPKNGSLSSCYLRGLIPAMYIH